MEELASSQQVEAAEGLDDAPQMLGIDATTAQRRYRDLQLEQQVREGYATTARRLFGQSVA